MKGMRWISVLSVAILPALIILGNSLAKKAVRPNTKPIFQTEVKIDNFNFGPDLTIKAGTTVTWTNHDDVPHVVASEDNIFKSNALDTDERFSYTFTKPGTYVYYCTVHPRMTAKVVVQ